MHFFVIDPDKCLLTKVAGKPSLSQMCDLLRCSLITSVRLYGTNDVLIADDEGLFGDSEYVQIHQSEVWIKEPYNERILRGSVIYIGTSTEGESIEPEHTFQYKTIEPAGNFITSQADPKKEVRARISAMMNIAGNFGQMPFITHSDDDGELRTFTIEEAIEQHQIEKF